jgi:hypothetical protein
MYGYQAIVDTINNEKATGYNSFGGESIFNNPNSEKSRMEYVQGMLDEVRRGDWNGYNASDIFGSKVQPALFQNAPYNPIDYGDVQGKTVGDNRKNLPDILGLTSDINNALRADSAFRIEQFAPGFGDNLRTMTNSAKALLGGRLPYSDVMDIVSNRQELGNTMGTAGTFTNATLKDLGISQLQAQQTGSEMMSRIGNLVESVDPIGQRSRPQDWTLSPSQTVPLKQQDTQFGASYDQMERILAQQSEQNANVLNAAPDPSGRGLFGAQFSMKTGTPLGGSGSTGAGSFDWGGLISGIYGAYRSSQSGGANPYSAGEQPAQRYNPDSQWSNTPAEGWESPNYDATAGAAMW